MHPTFRKRVGGGFALLVSMALLSAMAASAPGAAMAADPAPPRVGIVCTSGAGTNPVFDLTTRTGYISLPDGNTMFMWGYSSGLRRLPAPRPGALRRTRATPSR